MPVVAAPGGRKREFPYSPQGEQQAQSYAEQTGGQVSQRPPYGAPSVPQQQPQSAIAPQPATLSPYGQAGQQQQAAQSLMGYMPMMRQQPGAQQYGYDPMEVWHSIYDLMNNPQLSAGLGGASPYYLDILTQPLRDVRLGGPQPMPFPPGPGPGPVGAPGVMMPPAPPMNPMMGQPGQQPQGPYTPPLQF